MKVLELPEDLRNALVDYLAKRPYFEVMNFIPALMALEKPKVLKEPLADDGSEH